MMYPMRLGERLRACAVVIVAAGIPAVAVGQVPGAPVLQNAFNNPGLAVAANFGGGGGQSFYGAAAAWGMGSGRLQISAAAGAQRSNDATRGAYGGRVAASVWTSSGGGLGVGAFSGVGGAPRTAQAGIVTNPAVLIVPVGLTVGYRRALGTTRGLSAYASPLYRWTRSTVDTARTAGSVRVALGLDFSLSSSFGATVGAEMGSGGKAGGTGASTFGVAVTFVPGRR
jgi:hypothetical protein